MKKLLLAVGVVSSVFAIDLCERCWEVGAEYLYWRPCTDSYTYGFDASASQMQDLVAKPSYESGFRIFGATYTWDSCHCFWLDWVYLRTSDLNKKGVAAGTIFPNATVTAGDTIGKIKFRYNKVNIRAGRYISCYCDSLTCLFVGVRYVNIEHRREASLAAVNTFQKADFEGAAFEVGVGAEIEEPCNFYLIGHFAGVVGIGERKLRQAFTEGTNTFTYRHPSETACIPGLELRLGVKWRYSCDCLSISAEVGYHLDHYFNALRVMSGTRNVINGINAEFPFTTTIGVGFAGPYFQLSVLF